MPNTGIVGDVYKAGIVSNLFSQEVVNVLHYRQASANGTIEDSRTQLAKAIWSNIVLGALKPLVCNTLHFERIDIRDVIAPPGTVGGIDWYPDPNSQAGSVTTTCCPPTVAVVIRKRTTLLGRAYRGRAFFAGIPIGSTSLGLLSEAAQAAWEADLTSALAVTINSGETGGPDFAPVLVGALRAVQPGPITSYRVTPIVSADLDPVLRVQRRREIGVGV